MSKSKPYELWIEPAGHGRATWMSAFKTKESAIDAVPRKFSQYPKNLCWAIRLTGPGIHTVKSWPHPDRK